MNTQPTLATFLPRWENPEIQEINRLPMRGRRGPPSPAAGDADTAHTAAGEEKFTETIGGWESWGRVFQSIGAWRPLVDAILAREGAGAHPLENLTPGTNAVFRAGPLVVKIFAPVESGLDTSGDFRKEIFGITAAAARGVPVPRIVGAGSVTDRYLFRYLVTEYISGRSFEEARRAFASEEKYTAGKQVKKVTTALRAPGRNGKALELFGNLSFRTTSAESDLFGRAEGPHQPGCRTSPLPALPGGVDFLLAARNNRRWDAWPAAFNRDRLAFLDRLDPGAPRVFAHGDLNGDNIIVGVDQKLWVIDFADAVLAPAAYEDALVAAELFRFERPFMEGYSRSNNKNLTAKAHEGAQSKNRKAALS